ncbi:MAG: VanZ family protein [Acidobacteria bacterium]|nr:VanZ family protein [Acidobacteriota bacterium]
MKTFLLEYSLPVVVWLTIIYLFSTDAFSGAETSRFIVPFLRFFFPNLSPAELELWHGAIRKLGHITEYFILTLLAYRSFRFEASDTLRPKLITGGFVLLAAMTDEFHQSLTAFRGASLIDVGYDTFGAVWALGLMTLYEAASDRQYRARRSLHRRWL